MSSSGNTPLRLVGPIIHASAFRVFITPENIARCPGAY
jgi:hypothetical protein